MHRIAMRDIDRAISKRDRTNISHEWIMISCDEVEANAARNAAITKAFQFMFRIGLVAHMMQLGCITIDDHAIELTHKRTKRRGTARTAWAAEVHVADDQCAWDS
jgi:hypothetical protein